MGILCPEEEVDPPFHPPCGPSLHHAHGYLVFGQVCWWRKLNICRDAQFWCSCCHVLLLLLGCLWPRNSKVLVVEKIHHQNAAAPVCPHLYPQCDTTSEHHLWILKDLQLCSERSWNTFLCPFLKLL